MSVSSRRVRQHLTLAYSFSTSQSSSSFHVTTLNAPPIRSPSLSSPTLSASKFNSTKPEKSPPLLQKKIPKITFSTLLIYRFPSMASLTLPPSYPPSNLPVRRFKTYAAVNPSRSDRGSKIQPDIVRGALMSADSKRPWWAPLFGFSSRDPEGSERKGEDPEMGSDGSDAGRRKATACRSGLTEEKARLLRKEMRAMECWHDPMYHSAIATRLASSDQS